MAESHAGVPNCTAPQISEDSLDNLRDQIKAKNAHWVAGRMPTAENAVFLPPTPKTRRTTDNIVTIEQRKTLEQRAAFNPYHQLSPIDLPPVVDWRNRFGKNWAGTPQCQGDGTQTCVAFATCAALESRIRILMGNPSLEPGLSESQLYYSGRCYDAATGPMPWPTNTPNEVDPMVDDWTIYDAIEFVQKFGVITNQAAQALGFPAAPLQALNFSEIPDPTQIPAAGYPVHVPEYHALNDDIHRKLALALHGPIIGGIIVFPDFNYYRSGVYTHVAGDDCEGHAICIVGYDDTKGCWIVRNNWSANWGDDGFFMIAYDKPGDNPIGVSRYPSLDPVVTWQRPS